MSLETAIGARLLDIIFFKPGLFQKRNAFDKIISQKVESQDEVTL